MKLTKRAADLENLFFYKENKHLAESLKSLRGMEETRQTLSAASGIDDETILRRLIELNIRPETLASLALVPLIETAWADGRVTKEEREAVLAAVVKLGWLKGDPDYALLDEWLRHKPDPLLREAWVRYMQGICSKLTPGEVSRFKNEIMDQARAVAKISGGILGVGKVSTEEQVMLSALERAFKVCPVPSD